MLVEGSYRLPEDNKIAKTEIRKIYVKQKTKKSNVGASLITYERGDILENKNIPVKILTMLLE